METKSTKPLGKLESLCAVLMQRSMPGGAQGLDVDFVYKTLSGWVVIEFLRCVSVPPQASHPRRYWKNWRKFKTLWSLAYDLKARFFLINFEATTEDKYTEFGSFRIMRADMGFQPGENDPIRTHEVRTGTFEDFQKWINALDAEVVALSPGRCHYCKGMLAIEEFARCSGCSANACFHCAGGQKFLCEGCRGNTA